MHACKGAWCGAHGWHARRAWRVGTGAWCMGHALRLCSCVVTVRAWPPLRRTTCELLDGKVQPTAGGQSGVWSLPAHSAARRRACAARSRHPCIHDCPATFLSNHVGQIAASGRAPRLGGGGRGEVAAGPIATADQQQGAARAPGPPGCPCAPRATPLARASPAGPAELCAKAHTPRSHLTVSCNRVGLPLVPPPPPPAGSPR